MVEHCKRWDKVYGYDATELFPELKDIFVWVTKGKAGMNVKRRGNFIDHNYILIFKKL